MAFVVVGFILAFSGLALQWYVGKKADDEEARSKGRYPDPYKGRGPTKR